MADNLIGQAGYFLNTIAALLTRPADTTAYAASDAVSNASVTITGATNAAPIVITATAHGYSTGDMVTISGIVGNTAANANWVIVRIDANTFSLTGSTGNGAYSSGGIAVKAVRLVNAARRLFGSGNYNNINEASGLIRNVRLQKSTNGVTNASFRVYFFTALPTVVADNAAYPLKFSERAQLIGHVDLTLAIEGAGGDTAYAFLDTSNLKFSCPAGALDLFAQIVARAAYTPTSAEQFYLEIGVHQC